MELRVVHIISGLGIGGAERHLVDLINAMSCEYRAVIRLGFRSSGPLLNSELKSEVEQYDVRIRRRNVPVGIMKLAAVLRKNRANVVHTHMFESNLYGALAAKLANVPVVVTSEHGENPWKKPIHHWLERRIISPLVDIRFCVSPRILNRRRDVEGVPASKLRLTVNGTALPEDINRREQNAIPVIGAVGRFVPAKDYPRLLEALAILRDRGHKFDFVLLGDGPERHEIVNKIEELQIENVVNLPGLVTDVSSWYRKFDIYVSSSIREGQPVAMLEAMAHGLPVVTTDVGASAETVQCGSGGLVVPPANATALADALAQLLDNAQLREIYGNNARARVEQHFSVNAVAEQHLQCYREFLAAKTI